MIDAEKSLKFVIACKSLNKPNCDNIYDIYLEIPLARYAPDRIIFVQIVIIRSSGTLLLYIERVSSSHYLVPTVTVVVEVDRTLLQQILCGSG